ncbi:MAG: YggT family protein [Halioglobus sp.]|nr:YggT family protein [Halioglobus sp.]
MNAIYAILVYLIQTLLSLYLMVMLLRFVLQWVRADFYNPISQFVVKVTNPLVIPLRRVIPGYGGFDVATVLLAVLLQMAGIAAVFMIRFGAIPAPLPLLLGGLLGVVALLVQMYFFALLAMIILSWVAQGSRHPAILLLYQITEPLMAPVRKLLPPMGGLDFSPILAFILINIVQIALQHMAAAVGVLGFAPWLS